ncbi:DUF2958 domain-containing protein [Runella aurantiaca]|uniref:DUF2958 domain-containing protein n=1 Tax=Runella aurantiaca TaxID=2282308 RepID=A0A369I463_9BACT|nr:DUF2958 domain-containing protein [Runella aurantiaca]RDB02303.1 DUF2958 domain-containing protein [Runella aurantiaca]
MKLLTKTQKAKLLENGRNTDQDHYPVVKLFTPYAGATWLLSELDPDNERIAFGLCDLGMGYPELGYVDLQELADLKTSYGSPVVERDLYFKAKHPISVYADAARFWEHITTQPDPLARSVERLAEKAKQ